MTYRIGHFVDGKWRQFSHPAVYSIRQANGGQGKLTATAPGSDVLILQELSGLLEVPLNLLYVLHTSRGEAEAGRYQATGIDRGKFANFLVRFEQFLKTDGRYDLWVNSPASRATIVWDRHDLVHVYGIVEHAKIRLRQLGFVAGLPSIDFEHQHYYRQENDLMAAELFDAFDWSWSPLQAMDEQ